MHLFRVPDLNDMPVRIIDAENTLAPFAFSDLMNELDPGQFKLLLHRGQIIGRHIEIKIVPPHLVPFVALIDISIENCSIMDGKISLEKYKAPPNPAQC